MSDYLDTQSTIIHTNMYNYWHILKNVKKHKVYFSLFLPKKIILTADTLIYFWPKNKHEAYFQLQKLLSVLKKQSHIFIVGENHSGVKSAILILKNWITLKKIDSAKHCFLAYGVLLKNTHFNLKLFIKTYIWNKSIIKTLPGMFDYQGIDTGTKLLISTFTNTIKGEILDIGSGSGILIVSLSKISNDIQATLSDVNLISILSSRINLHINNFKGNVLCSDLYSDIDPQKKFNMIISNPPLHNGLKMSLDEIVNFIKQSVLYLKPKGEIRFVVNNCISCSKILSNTFTTHCVLKKNDRFKICQAFL